MVVGAISSLQACFNGFNFSNKLATFNDPECSGFFFFFSFLEGACPEGAYEKVLGGPSSTFQLPVVD